MSPEDQFTHEVTVAAVRGIKKRADAENPVASIEDLKGTVSKLHFQGPTFCAGRVKLPGSMREESFAGKIHVCIDQIVHMKGSWVMHPKFGRQFDCKALVSSREIDGDGLLAWLEKKGAGLGIGPVKAKRILAHFADEFAATLELEPEKIAAFAKVDLEGIQQLSKYYATHKEETAIYADLAAIGLTDYLCTIIIQRYGSNAVSVIEANPYRLADEVHGIGFAKADEIAKQLGVSEDAPTRIRAAVLHAMQIIQDRGSTCTLLDGLVDESEKLLNGYRDHVIHCVAERVDMGELVKVVDGQRDLYAIPSMAAVERNIAAFMRDYNSPRDWELDIEAGIKKHGDFLDPDQKDAVRGALTKGIVVVTGPAGSGKSTTINTIVKIANDVTRGEWDENGFRVGKEISVGLCAPTGKAARRMEEIIGKPASTVHRLLKYQPPNTWTYCEENKLPYDMVIVDESSMNDSPLFWKLMQAIPRGGVLVIVGDHNQLPPVGPGAALRDAIAHKLVPVIDLHTVHRNAGNLRKNSAKILEGVMMPTAARLPSGKPEWVVDDRHSDEATLLPLLDNLFLKTLPELGYDALKDVQFMSPRRKGVKLCSEQLSERFQVLHQRRLGREIPPTPEKRRAILYPGDKVIQTRNNYQLDIMNGTLGMVVATAPRLVVKFEIHDEPIEIPNDQKGDIDLAYWLTVHKYQGSQIPVCVFLCVSAHLGHWESPMLHRNLAYTAATRAQQLAIIIGDVKGCKGAVERTAEDKRLTLLPVFAKGKS